MTKVSVIIPVYNTAECLEYLFRDIDRQIFKDAEYIFINDGSKDDSLERLIKFTKNRENCKLFNQKNQGVSAARNNGLAYAEGEYIVFVDSDDRLSKEFLFNYVKAIEKNNSDIEVFSSLKIDNLKTLNVIGKIDYSHLINKGGNFEFKDYIKYILNFNAYGYLHSYIFKRELWYKRKFNTQIDSWEDLLSLYQLLCEFPNKKIHVNGSAYYYYYQRNSSKLHTESLDQYKMWVQVSDIMCKLTMNSKVKFFFPYALGFKLGVLKLLIAYCVNNENLYEYNLARKSFLLNYHNARFFTPKKKITRSFQYISLLVNSRQLVKKVFN